MGCVLERDMARALALYDEARTAHGVRPDAYTLKLLLDACSRAGDARAGLALCAEARAEGVLLDAAARGAMLRACLQEDYPDPSPDPDPNPNPNPNPNLNRIPVQPQP